MAFAATGTIEDPNAFGVGPFPVGAITINIDTEMQLQD